MCYYCAEQLHNFHRQTNLQEVHINHFDTLVIAGRDHGILDKAKLLLKEKNRSAKTQFDARNL